MYDRDRPQALRPVGETAFVHDIALQTADGSLRVAAGIVSHANLTLGAAVDEVLEEHTRTSANFRGIRHSAAWDASDALPFPRSSQGLLHDAKFREGFACLEKRGLSFDAWLYHPQLPELVEPISRGEADLVVGSRALGMSEPGSLSPVQVLGNRLATTLLRWLYGGRFTDLGPFRAIRWQALEDLGMRDRDYGWTVEMQARALRAGLRCNEVPVRYRRRTLGRSKVSGTVRGIVGAGWKILFTIGRVRVGG